MYRRRFVAVITLLAASVFPAEHLLAQFSSLFGGPEVEIIETKQLKEKLDRQREREKQAEQAGEAPPAADFVVVDVRSQSELDVSIIPGAITKETFEKHRDKYKGRMVIPYCTVGGRSGRYASQLAKQGDEVRNYKGSILEWVRAELPLVTLDGKPTKQVHTYSDRYEIPAKYERVLK